MQSHLNVMLYKFYKEDTILLAENNRHNRNEFSIEHYKVGESSFFFKEVENSLKKVNANCEEVQIEHNNKKVNKHIYMIPI